MTSKKMILRPKIALYEPDIPQNTASIIRTCSCLSAMVEIIEPCGFMLNDKRFRRVVMDYFCLLYTTPSPRDVEESRMPSSA